MKNVQIVHWTRGHVPGDVIEVDDVTARKIVRGGRGVIVDAPEPEPAAKSAPKKKEAS